MAAIPPSQRALSAGKACSVSAPTMNWRASRSIIRLAMASAARGPITGTAPARLSNDRTGAGVAGPPR